MRQTGSQPKEGSKEGEEKNDKEKGRIGNSKANAAVMNENQSGALRAVPLKVGPRERDEERAELTPSRSSSSDPSSSMATGNSVEQARQDLGLR